MPLIGRFRIEREDEHVTRIGPAPSALAATITIARPAYTQPVLDEERLVGTAAKNGHTRR